MWIEDGFRGELVDGMSGHGSLGLMRRLPNLSVAVAVFLGIPLIMVGAFVFLYRDLALQGPVSEDGLVAVVVVRDRGFGPGADFEADVVIRDAAGKDLARDRDDSGGYGDEGAQRVVDSMHWVGPGVFEFEQVKGIVERLEVP